ncbi:Ig-like domain-containing protein [Pseudomonas sp. AK106]
MARLPPTAGSVQVLDNGVPLGTATLQADGTWSLPAAGLAQGTHTFTARVDGVISNPWTVNIQQNNEMNLVEPHFKNATSAGNGREQINYYAYEGDGYVEIPAYGALNGDTVRVSWVGRSVTIDSEIQTVTNPAIPLVFKISMYEVIDCIGVNATIKYTVVRPPSNEVHRSLALSLTVMGHSGAIAAPTINSPDNNNLRVQFATDYYSAQARFIGLTTVESPIKQFNGNYINFTIDQTWLNANRGRPVLFNWSLKRFGNSQIFYSQILRVNDLKYKEVDPGTIEQFDPATRDAIQRFIASAYVLIKLLFKR